MVSVSTCRAPKWKKDYGHTVAAEAMEKLSGVLKSSEWRFIVMHSQAIARHAGLDEIRCDWLIGDDRAGGHGPRLGEVQYIGSAGRVPAVLQPLMAHAYLRCHAVYDGAMLTQSAQMATTREEHEVPVKQKNDRVDAF
eukprot:SAG31_NODE_924_length_10963_cov_4.339286_3_plen_138_part_00